ncbi:MAG: Beta-lactamase superfamily domain protein [Candidatus Bathyarchaeota archaeon BA2]|nr:MAG: Beta-lactamase superfamily domain protein [Candidatus Bathyarchaeota archaeon BA2]
MSKAGVTKKGAVLLGKHVACDGFDEDKPLRVVTHAHSDHMLGLRQSLKRCEAVLMTPATKDLIDVMKGPQLLMKGNVKTLDYGETLAYEDEQLTLRYADHILGTAQVLVEDAEGIRILYTSDFKLSKTPVVEADVLVLEATYGNPYRVRPFGMMAEGILVSLVEQGLKRGPVYVFGYHGKLQEAMQILHKAEVEAPFVVPEPVFQVSKVCERHGMRLGNCLLLSSEEKAQSILNQHEPCVAFYHMYSRRNVGKETLRIYATGWQFIKPCQKIGKGEYRVALSDHSDFNGLLQYVEKCRPKMVITDNHRSGDALALAKEIERQLNIPARPVPS